MFTFFTHDTIPGVFRAVATGPTWNGWCTPVVTVAELRRLLIAADVQHTVTTRWAVVHHEATGEVDTLVVSDAGTVDLGPLGWTFDTVAPVAAYVAHLATRPVAEVLEFGGERYAIRWCDDAAWRAWAGIPEGADLEPEQATARCTATLADGEGVLGVGAGPWAAIGACDYVA